MSAPITAEPLCRTRGCPEPNNPDWHRPEIWCGHATTHGMHQHVPKRGSGGHNPKSKIEAFLCESCTKKIDEGPWGNAMLDFPGVGRFWRIWDEHNNTLFQRLIEPREEVRSAPRQGPGFIATKESTDEDKTQAPAPWEEWVGKVQTLANAIAVMPWAIGDLINEGEERFGEMAWQHLDTLGMDYARLSNYAWLAKTFPPTTRVVGLHWSHHREVAALPAPEREAKLREALTQNMSTRELHVAIKGEPEPVRRRCPSCGHIGPLSEFPKEEKTE